MVRPGTEEYQLFAVRKPKLAPPGTGAPRPLVFRERLPAWVPARLKAPLEEFLRRFLGEVEPGQVPAWLLRLELSWPRAQGWAHAGGVLHGVGILYAWWYGMGAQSAVAGWVTGAVYGVVLRTRAEQRFDWPAYGPALMLAALLATSLRGAGWAPTNRHDKLPLAVLQGVPGVGPLFRLVGLLHYPLLLALALWWPFVKDVRSLRVGNDRLLYGLLALAVLFGSNTFLALGAWYGGLVKAVRERRPTHGAPPAAAATAGAPVVAVPTMQQQQQLQQQQLLLQAGFPAAAAAAATGAVPPYAGGAPFLGPQPSAPMAPAPAAEVQLAAAAAALRYQQQAAAEASHPRRWLDEPEPAPYDEYGVRGGGLASRRRSTGTSRWEAATPGWREAPAAEEGPRYGLRSRGQRRASASMLPPAAAMGMAPVEEDDGGDMMDLSDSPPPPPAAAHALRAPGFYNGARRLHEGLGRYETMNPY